jgi:deoxyribose-phosphate aldolase
MDDNFILSHVDHTLLSAFSSLKDVFKLCNEAIAYKTASICIPPSYVYPVHKEYPELNICTVIGFPLGYSVMDVKVKEIDCAKKDGAQEFDAVINIGDVKNGEFDKITREIQQLKSVSGDKILKIIIETCYLTEEEKISVCRCVTSGGADYIKTSTGFGTAGAVISDIQLFKRYIGEKVRIKAAGGIKTRNDMVAFIEAGCSRIGTSSAIKILAGEESGGY